MELGIEHRPFEEGLREYLEWELEHQGMDTQLTDREPETSGTRTVS